MNTRLTISTLVLAAALASAGCSAQAWTAGAGEVSERPVIAQVMDSLKSPAPMEVGADEAPAPYAYYHLNAADQDKYRILYDVFQSREARSYPDDDMDALTRVQNCVLADHPELFDVGSVHMETTTNVLTGEVTKVTVEGRYAYSAEDAAAVLQRAQAAAEECFASLPAGANDYSKAKRAYEFLFERVEYLHDWSGVTPSPDQTIEGALVNGRAVCGGYANAFTYLMHSVGVQCATISGIGDGVDHAWCLALLDGDYYYIDPTWGDPLGGSLNYDYLAITTADAEQEHTATSPFELPECTAVADNYYVYEGLMFDWADEGRLAELVMAGYDQFRCADQGVYAQLLDYVTSGHLAGNLGVEQYRYSNSDALLTLKVWIN